MSQSRKKIERTTKLPFILLIFPFIFKLTIIYLFNNTSIQNPTFTNLSSMKAFGDRILLNVKTSKLS